MIKVLYLSFNDPDLSPGVFQKEREFCEFFGELGRDHHMEFTGLCIVTSLTQKPESIRNGRYLELKKIPSLPYRMFSQIPLFCSLFRIRPVFTQAYEDIANYNPDIIIWRYNITSVPGIFNPKKVCPEVILVSEHQAKEIEELCISFVGRILSPLVKHMGIKVLRGVDAVLGVTTEITSYELAMAGKNIPSLTLTNSIDVKQYPLKNKEGLSNNTFRLLYVGSNTTDWHGLDRLLKGMAGYHGDIRLELHLAGNVSSSVKRLIRSLKLDAHVFVHGYVTGKELDSLFDITDVAVGTLGMHRKKLTHGSTLKVREYMARGIPFMISYTDDDLSTDLPYVFVAPADESPIDIEKVIRFSRKIHSTYGSDLSTVMHAYALEHMDYRIKTIKLLEFIVSILRSLKH